MSSIQNRRWHPGCICLLGSEEPDPRSNRQHTRRFSVHGTDPLEHLADPERNPPEWALKVETEVWGPENPVRLKTLVAWSADQIWRTCWPTSEPVPQGPVRKRGFCFLTWFDNLSRRNNRVKLTRGKTQLERALSQRNRAKRTTMWHGEMSGAKRPRPRAGLSLRA